MVNLFFALVWIQLAQPLEFPKLESTVATLRSGPPRQGFVRVIYHDGLFLFVHGPNPDRRKEHSCLFVHSMAQRRWRQITAVSTAGGRLETAERDPSFDDQRLIRATRRHLLRREDGSLRNEDAVVLRCAIRRDGRLCPSQRPRGTVRQSTLMIEMIYARKSTDQGGIADEQKSVTLDHVRHYAARKGRTVDDLTI